MFPVRECNSRNAGSFLETLVSVFYALPRFEDPLPLCETPSGWEWSGTGKASLGLLGDVSMRAEKKVGLPGGLAG